MRKLLRVRRLLLPQIIPAFIEFQRARPKRQPRFERFQRRLSRPLRRGPMTAWRFQVRGGWESPARCAQAGRAPCAESGLREKAAAATFVTAIAHNCEVVIHDETRARHNLTPIEYGVVFAVAWVSNFDVLGSLASAYARGKVFLGEGMVRSQRDINRVLDQA